jgi:hypothetical protein
VNGQRAAWLNRTAGSSRGVLGVLVAAVLFLGLVAALAWLAVQAILGL